MSQRPRRKSRNGRKRSSSRGKNSTRAIALRALRRSKPEMKIGYIQQNGTPFDWDGSLIQVGQLQQGMDTDNRIGNEVFLHRVTFKGSFSQSQAGDDNTIKVALILYRGSPPAIPLASTFFTNTGTVGAPIGFQQNVLDGSYRILYQKTFNLTDTYPTRS